MRSFVRAGVIIVSLAVLALTVLLVTALAIATVVALWRGHSPLDRESLTTGLVCSLILWLFVAVFHLGRTTLSIAVPNPDGFLDRAREVMKDFGYDVAFQSADQLLASPAFHSLLFGGGILLRIDKQRGKISGPKLMAELVRRRLRLVNHIDRVQQTMHDQRRRSSSRLLKRIQIAVKVKPEQIEEVRRNVVEPLAAEGTVICMLTILAQSDNGIRELGPTHPIRTWLEQQGLKADFQRDHVELSEPMANTPYVAYHGEPNATASS